MIDTLLSLSTAGIGLAVLALYTVVASLMQAKRTFVDAPRVGRAGILGSFDYMRKGRQILQEGYVKYNSSARKVFKIRNPGKDVVYVMGRALIEELRKAPEDVLSFNAGFKVVLQSEYTLGSTIVANHYHLPILRSQLTRNLAALFPAIDDEISAAFHANIDAKLDAKSDSKLDGNEWIKVPAYATVLDVIARVTNRMMVGLPLCRNPDFIRLSIKITTDVVYASEILKRLPRFLRPLAAKWVSAVPSNVRQATSYVGPAIALRRAMRAKYGDDYPDKPNDMLSWLMDVAEGDEQSEVQLVTRIMTLNFAGVHTSSMSFTHVLYHLAAHPEHAPAMRAEIDRIVAEEGWSKASLGNMHRLDSFVRESLRVNGIGSVSLSRLALKPYTFADGTHIPAGAWVATPSAAMHGDQAVYADGLEFRPFRFVPESVLEGEEGADGKAGLKGDEGQGEGGGGSGKAYAVSTSPEYLPFGHGQHACPGRFFAVTELKMMLAYVLQHYDVKLDGAGIRPANLYFGDVVMPNTTAGVMFRRRAT